MSGGSTGERAFTDIITSVRYLTIHAITLPLLFVTGWLLVGTGLIYDVTGSPRANEYFSNDRTQNLILNTRMDVSKELLEL